jgi:hypothetical protein
MRFAHVMIADRDTAGAAMVTGEFAKIVEGICCINRSGHPQP